MFFLCLFCHFVCQRWSGRITWCWEIFLQPLHVVFLPYQSQMSNLVVLVSQWSRMSCDHWPCPLVFMMSGQAPPTTFLKVALDFLLSWEKKIHTVFCSTVCQISTGTVVSREVPVFLYLRGQEGNLQLSSSLDSTLSAWKDKGIRPLTVRLAQLRWSDQAVADLRR